MLVFLALGDAKVLSFALGDAKVPDARYFAFWWNIGFRVLHCNCPKYIVSGRVKGPGWEFLMGLPGKIGLTAEKHYIHSLHKNV